MGGLTNAVSSIFGSRERCKTLIFSFGATKARVTLCEGVRPQSETGRTSNPKPFKTFQDPIQCNIYHSISISQWHRTLNLSRRLDPRSKPKMLKMCMFEWPEGKTKKTKLIKDFLQSASWIKLTNVDKLKAIISCDRGQELKVDKWKAIISRTACKSVRLGRKELPQQAIAKSLFA